MQQLIREILPLLGRRRLLGYIGIAILSGLCGFCFVRSVTYVLDLIITRGISGVDRVFLTCFATLILGFAWTRRSLSTGVIRLSQSLFWSVRRQILALVLRADYRRIESSKGRIYAAMVNDVNSMTQASLTIIEFFTSTVMTVACLIYLAIISPVLFGVTLVTAFLGVASYYSASRRNLGQFEKARQLENRFMDSFNSILNGFKEIYMAPEKGKAIYERKINVIAEETLQNNVNAFTGFLDNQVIGQVLFYILISSVLIFFSIWFQIPAKDTVSFVFTLLYLLSAVETIMVLLPGLARARVSAGHLLDLKNELQGSIHEEYTSKSQFPYYDFERIALRDLQFSYGEADSSFRIGPVDLEICRGDTIFIYGGNGSGKTTLVYSVLGLILPSSGEILVDDFPVGLENYEAYRSLFAAVFTDYYLFEELPWISTSCEEKVNEYLRIFELEGKVSFGNKRFSTTALSAGQRKRLALIALLLEEKPLLVLDEWAADQDPYFRKKFYTEIIPLLKNRGFTVIAITHDDQYYHLAEKLYKMEYGKLLVQSPYRQGSLIINTAS